MGEEKKGESPFLKPASILRGSDPVRVSRIAGCSSTTEPDGHISITVPVLHGTIKVYHPSMEIQASDEVNTFVLKLLTLLYLAGTNGADPSGKWVPYRELPGARFYEPVFKRSVEVPLALEFGSDPQGFSRACKAIGGSLEDLGDASYAFNLFPKVLLCFVLWAADDEFSAEAQVLFDSAACNHLNAFDLRMGAEEISKRLIRLNHSQK